MATKSTKRFSMQMMEKVNRYAAMLLAVLMVGTGEMWGATTTMPTSGSYSNATTKYELSNSAVTGGLYIANRTTVTVTATYGWRPSNTGIGMQVSGPVQLTYTIKSNTTDARTITGRAYSATDVLWSVWKNTTASTQTLENYVIAVNAKAEGSRTEEEAAIAANGKLKTITGSKDANKKMLILETGFDETLATAHGRSISHACPTTKGATNSFKDTLTAAGKYVIYLTSSGGSVGITSIDVVPFYTVTHSLTNVTKSSGSTGSLAALSGSAYNAVFAAADGYTLPETITVTIGGKSATAETDYTWNSSTGAFQVLAAKVTGAIVVTIAGEAACSAPDAPTISSEDDQDEFTEGETITLTALCASGADASTKYTWYKGADWATASAASPVQAAATGSSGYTFTKTAATSDAGTYWCEASNGADCKSHNSTGFEISVNEAVKAYTVTADTNNEDWGTAEASASTADEDDEVTITATAEEGYKFVSWSVSGEGSSLSSTTDNPTTLTVGTADVTVTATFRALSTYTISYNAGSLEGATGSKDSESKTEDAAFTLPSSAVFSCDGYTQNGWNTNTDGASGIHYALGGSYTTNAAQTFYPEWKINTPTISFTCSTNTVTITVLGGSTVRYTTDGTDPSTTTGTVYSEAFVLDETSTVKAIAYQSGFTTSEIASKACPVCVEPDKYTNEIARFFIPCCLSYAGKWNVTNQESSTGANTFTTSEFGGSSSNWSTNATTGLIYGKFSSNDTYISLKLKSGNFKAGDIVSAYVNSTTNNLKFSKSSNTFGSATASGLSGEYVRSATLVAEDIEDDGSIKIMRNTSGVSINRIIVVRNGHAITKSETNGTIATTNSSSVAISAAKADETVYIAATPNTGYTFTSWSVVGDESEDEVDVTGSAGVYSFTMPDEPVTVAATFTAINYTITHSAASNGSYTIQVASGSAVSTNTTANYGQTITLAATPSTGYLFDHWTVTDADEGSVTVTSNTFTMPAKAVTVAATFVAIPNIYYYKDATHYTGSTYKAPDGSTATLKDNQTINSGDEWTVSNTIAGIIVKAKGCTYDGKGTYMNAYLKMPKGGGKDDQYVSFTIATGCKANSLKIKIGGYSSNPKVTLKPLVNSTLGSAIDYSGTVGGVATTENNFNALTWSNLAAGTYILNVSSQNAYISEMSAVIEYLPVEEDADSWADAFATAPTLEDDITLGAGGTGDPITITITSTETAKAKSITLNNAKLNIQAGGALIVANTISKDGSATAAGDIHLGSDAEHGNAALVMGNYDGTNANAASVDFYTLSHGSKGSSASVNQYVGTPFSDASILRDYYNSWMYKITYTDGEPGWTRITNGNEVLNPFQGYCVISADEAGHVYNMAGTLVATTNRTLSGLHWQSGEGAANLNNENLLANSWTAPIKIGAFETTDFVNTDATVYIFNSCSQEGYTSFASNYTTYTVNTSTGANDVIPAMQSFSVFTTGTNASVTLDYEKLVYNPALATGDDHANIVPNKAPRRTTQLTEDDATKIRLFVRAESGYGDMLYMWEREDFAEGFENGWDGRKMFGESVAPQLYAVTPDGNMAVNCVPDLEGTVIGFKAGTEDTTYTFTFEYNGEYELYLYDTYNTNPATAYTRIETGSSYPFDVDDVAAHNRFILTRQAPQMPTDLEPTSDSSLKGRERGVKFIEGEKMFILMNGVLYDATGRRVERVRE